MIGFPLRVTYQQHDFIYYIIAAPSKKNHTLEILLDAKSYTFILGLNKLWIEKDPDKDRPLDQGLVLAISRAVTLRYPI